MAKEIPVIRKKVYRIISRKLVDKHLLKKIDLSRDVEYFEEEFFVLKDVYLYLREKAKDVRVAVEGKEFVNFLYSILLGVLDVGEKLLEMLEEIIEKNKIKAEKR
jgi:hypothetical protein